jgi:hypothetical protein
MKMPFCVKCGKEMENAANFCISCGAAQTTQINLRGANKLDDKWAWLLACVPIIGLILESFILAISGFVSYVMTFVIYTSLYFSIWKVDVEELKKKNFNPTEWIWFILLVPVYLFLRASKTNQKYGYAIAWCVLFVLSIILDGMIFDSGEVFDDD